MNLSPKPRGVAPGYLDFAPLGRNSKTEKTYMDFFAPLGRSYAMKYEVTI
jgi:hypothetical protein